MEGNRRDRWSHGTLLAGNSEPLVFSLWSSVFSLRSSDFRLSSYLRTTTFEPTDKML